MANEPMDEPIQAEGASELEVRPARPGDRDAVLAFCAHTWSDGDYIEYVWDDWLADDRGVLLVGLLDGQPVAINHLQMVSDDEAWLEGMRVDPRYRREGFGRILTSRTLVAARERGASVARLITSSDNLASQGMITRFGFVRVAEMVRYRGPAFTTDDTTPTAALARPGVDDFERLWEWLEQSNLAPLTGGLEYGDWQARALTEPLLRGYLASGQVRLIEEWDTIQALAIVTPPAEDTSDSGDSGGSGEMPTLDVRYLDGQADAIGRLALALRAEAAAHYGRVELWLPDLLILHDAMDGAGYERDDETMLVFARAL
ncbi:MAG TPA: GNAT family N-acetyltransferase [Ktedonobacterales bacterium]